MRISATGSNRLRLGEKRKKWMRSVGNTNVALFFTVVFLRRSLLEGALKPSPVFKLVVLR